MTMEKCILPQLKRLFVVKLRTMDDRVNLTYQGHQGLLRTSSNRVIFYGKEFENICDAVKTLKDLTAGEQYFTWFYNYHCGFIHEISGRIYIDNRWLPDENFAEKYVDMKKNNS